MFEVLEMFVLFHSYFHFQLYDLHFLLTSLLACIPRVLDTTTLFLCRMKFERKRKYDMM